MRTKEISDIMQATGCGEAKAQFWLNQKRRGQEFAASILEIPGVESVSITRTAKSNQMELFA